jgi:4-amino-4-deoxy-L-arabinose transferase-like glycosyltransferase
MLLRLLVVELLPTVPIGSDAQLYSETARVLAGLEEGSPAAIFYRGIGYPAALAAVYLVVGDQYELVRLAQALMWSGAGALVFLVVAREGSRVGGLAGTSLLILVPSIATFSTLILTEGWLALLLTASIAALVLLTPTRPRVGVVVYGVAVALLALSHSAWQFYPLLALPALFVALSWRTALVGMTACVVTLAAVLVPAHIIVPGQPWIQGQGGAGFGAGGAWTLYVGNRPATTGVPTLEDYDLAEGRTRAIRAARRRGTLDPAIASRIPRRGPVKLADDDYMAAARENFRRQPAATLGVLLLKQYRLWVRHSFLPPLGRADRYLSAPEGSLGPQPDGLITRPTRRALDRFGTVVAVVLCLTALAGIGLALRQRRMLLATALVTPVAFTAAIFGIGGSPESRYAFPAFHALAIAAGLAVATLLDIGRRKRLKSV